jgi:hypothetical protein
MKPHALRLQIIRRAACTGGLTPEGMRELVMECIPANKIDVFHNGPGPRLSPPASVAVIRRAVLRPVHDLTRKRPARYSCP